ncbi:GNAT family N-acetyltransferase [Micromonospora sp. NPDC049559]|uniref:GNAT family N-acetyltransferase n=1 Tax=Micromonospora sp. NPDC049559 TaxID=3155923 RepID=UPI003418631A
MLIESRPSDDAELVTLVTARQRELCLADGGLDGHVAVLRDGARYLVGVIGGRAVACGALQPLDAETAEVKRIYVRPAHRRRGIAGQLLAALEELAYLAGHTVLRIETRRYSPAAIGLYTSSGYGRIPAYGEYASDPYSVCFEKRLAVAV